MLQWVGDDQVRSVPPAPPIAWTAVDRVECRRGSIAVWAWLGAMAAPAGYRLYREITAPHDWNTGDNFDELVAVGLVPVGALVGTLWGAAHPLNVTIWRRPAAAAN